MNAHQIKAICHELGDLFTHKRCAEAAGVAQSTWSSYCDYEQPDTTLPMHRMFMVEDRLHRRDFTSAIAERAGEAAVSVDDPRPAAARALAALSDAVTSTTSALADGEVKESEKRRMQEDCAALASRVHEMSASIAALPTGRVKLRAV